MSVSISPAPLFDGTVATGGSAAVQHSFHFHLLLPANPSAFSVSEKSCSRQWTPQTVSGHTFVVPDACLHFNQIVGVDRYWEGPLTPRRFTHGSCKLLGASQWFRAE
jgi:hypothetical protein